MLINLIIARLSACEAVVLIRMPHALILSVTGLKEDEGNYFIFSIFTIINIAQTISKFPSGSQQSNYLFSLPTTK